MNMNRLSKTLRMNLKYEIAEMGVNMKNLHTLDKYRLADQETRIAGQRGDSGCGCFKVFVGGRSFFVVASDGGGWDHVSVSPCNQKRCPTWEEMCAIKDMFFEPEECAVQYHPPKSEYVNNHPFCLHLWRPNKGADITIPPKLFV